MAFFTPSTNPAPPLKIALAGNPNSGKSTLFNLLTGLRQKTGNFPGVTVDLHLGTFRTNSHLKIEVIDLPGTYSLFPKSLDEQLTTDVLCDKNHKQHPSLTLVVADSTNLKRSLYLCTQLIDIGMPVILVLNMIDIAQRRTIVIDEEKLSLMLGVSVLSVNSKSGAGMDKLKKAIETFVPYSPKPLVDLKEISSDNWVDLQTHLGAKTPFDALVKYVNSNDSLQEKSAIFEQKQSEKISLQTNESIARFKLSEKLVLACVSYPLREINSLTKTLDNWFTHKIWGFIIFLFILFCIFQCIFTFSELPMEWIENLFVWLSNSVEKALPPGILNDILTKGILAGLGGVVVFIPQIAFLFAFIAILEDSGYMARVSFIMDKAMRKFGLNGKSIIPLISGAACAVPAIMGTRTISNSKERLITILVIPLMSCSARIPVYTLLISLVVPNVRVLGLLNMQGIVLMALYLIGFLSALGAAFLLKYFVKTKEKSYFIMELPIYRVPQVKQVIMVIYDKVRMFVYEAGKIIVAISVILWLMASYAPGNAMQKIDEKYALEKERYSPEEIDHLKASDKLEASYAGIAGKFIEPIIAPLGFDWKIGISLVTSFAAREVFVGTMATIYSIGSDADELSVREKMKEARNPTTGQPVYTLAVGFSLMIFYAFALQCMSTIAVVYRETGGYKWPLIQLLFLSALAYCSSFVVYHVLQ